MKWLKKAVLGLLAALMLSAGALCEAYMSQGYSVYLPNGLVGLSPVAVAGGDYAFAIGEGDQDRYHYSISATMNGVPVELEDRGYGIYMIRNVTGNIHVSMTRQVKTFSVTVTGSGADLVTCGATAVYGEIFRFYADPEKVEISVTVDGEPCRSGSGEGGKYVLIAPNVKGDIVITAKKIGQMFPVTFAGSGAADAVGNAQAKEGEAYRFTQNKAAGYTYRVTATMGGSTAAVTAEGANGYVIGAVSAPLVITVEKVKQAVTRPENQEPSAVDGENSGGVTLAPEQESPPEDVPEEPKPPETAEVQKSAEKPSLPDVTIGTFAEEEEREPFPWWAVTAGAAAILAAGAALLLAGCKRVVFVTGCDAVVRTQRILKGKLAVRPAEPRKSGAIFAGWFVDETLAERWIFEENRVKEHMVLYAKWI